ncbi:MAG: hypothetical protein JKY31_04115 [Rhodobacteraceae bacterium]|nr:hypothetical protein [Paracoccaceae bacterium]
MAKLKAISAASILAAILATSAAQAGDLRAQLQFGGVFDWAQADSLDADLGFTNREMFGGNLRLMWTGGTGAWAVEFHSVLSFAKGDMQAYGAALAPFLPTPPPSTWLNLTSAIYTDEDIVIANTIDRLSVSFTSDNFVLKVGRQAITWGGGTVFHPLDIVAAFAPNAIDTSYKPGVDMVYGQYLFDSGADIQAIYVPRAAVAGGGLDWGSSTVGLHGSALLGNFDGSFTLAVDRGDTLAGIGLSGPLGGAVWNAEYAGWFLENGDFYGSYLLNISTSGSLFGANTMYFAEYFHNDFGVDGSVALDDLPTELTSRLVTGQVFATGRDLLVIGAQISVTPDISIAPNAIISLDDGSVLAALQANWNMDDNTDLTIGYHQPFGANGTEFGGRETTIGSGVFQRSASELSINISRFF